MARLKIGVLLKDRTPGFWIYAEKGAQEAAQALDVDLIVKAPPTVLDVAAQRQLLAALVAENIDALVIAPINPSALEDALRELAQTGMKIVVMDTPIKEGIAKVFVGADQVTIGEAVAKVFLAIHQEGEETAMLRNNSLDRSVLTRENKFIQVVRAQPGLSLHSEVFASSARDTEEDQAKFLLTKYPEATLIFASATRGTLATIKAVREMGLVGKVRVVGFGTYLPAEAAQAFEDDILYGWVAQQPKDIGTKAIQSAVALIEGKSVPPMLQPDFMLVTTANFHSPKAQALLNP